MVTLPDRVRKSCKRGNVRLARVRTPAGAIIGPIILEEGERVFVRSVQQRHLFRELDGWSLGEYALEQLLRWRVGMIRYRSPEGIYETPVSIFTASAIPREFEPNPERQHILPRHLWATRPAEVKTVSSMDRVKQMALPGVV